jgi:hypothetical protein
MDEPGRRQHRTSQGTGRENEGRDVRRAGPYPSCDLAEILRLFSMRAEEEEISSLAHSA